MYISFITVICLCDHTVPTLELNSYKNKWVGGCFSNIQGQVIKFLVSL